MGFNLGSFRVSQMVTGMWLEVDSSHPALCQFGGRGGQSLNTCIGKEQLRLHVASWVAWQEAGLSVQLPPLPLSCLSCEQPLLEDTPGGLWGAASRPGNTGFSCPGGHEYLGFPGSLESNLLII